MYATHNGGSIKKGVCRKRGLGSCNLHKEGLESKRILLPAFHSKSTEITGNGSSMKWLLLSFAAIE